jgi:hypothetical protein
MVVLSPPAGAVFVPPAHGAVFNWNWFGMPSKLIEYLILENFFYVPEICRNFGKAD